MADAAAVLFVEDSPTQAEQIRGILEEGGYRVRMESNGCEALAALKREPAEVVLSDIVMPGKEFSKSESELLTGTETILLAEDEQMVGNIMDEVLVQAGYTVVRAASGHEALELCRSRGTSVDLILSDVVMPDMRGPEMALRIRETLPDVKIILMSGYPDLGEVSQILPGPHDIFLQKPVSVEILLSAVRKVLDRKMQEKLEINEEVQR